MKSKKENHSEFVYVHYLLPHGSFYLENEFPYLKRNLDIYILFWDYCNVKIIKYLSSIENLKTWKIIISGDHGFRSSHLINPSKTQSAFYNFQDDEIDSISMVQDIGGLLLKQ